MYLVEKYDVEHKISFDKYEDKIQQLQWLFFQASGQGYASVFYLPQVVALMCRCLSSTLL